MLDRLRYLGTVDGKSKESKRRQNNELLLQRHQQLLRCPDHHFRLQPWVKFRTESAKRNLKKRQVKMYQKEAMVLCRHMGG